MSTDPLRNVINNGGNMQQSQSKKTMPNNHFAKEKNWWRGSVIYQIYPRSFQDSNGDGIGDIAGITSRLEYVADLGVETIWLSPIFTSPMKDMGYDVSNYTDIDPQFGSLEDFDNMVARAHELGLKVMIDQVISHSSDQHEFFKESRSSKTNDKSDWYVWADPNTDGSPPNNWPAVFGGSAWEWEPRRQQYYMHNFLIEQPDFNFHNPKVQQWHLENMRFWLDRGVDGFRLDTVNFYFHDEELRDNPADPRKLERYLNTYDMQYHIYSKNRPENIAFLEKMRVLCDEYDAAMVGEMGEAHHSIEMMGEYTKGESRLNMCYSFEFLGDDHSPNFFRKKIEQFRDGAPDGWPCWAFSNHDVRRHLSRWFEDGEATEALAKQSGALLLSLYGSICIYQGEELGQLETEMEFHELTDPPGIRFWPENKGRDGCRTPMVWDAQSQNGGFSNVKPWLPVKAPQHARAVDLQLNNPKSVHAYYKKILAFRKTTPSFTGDEISFMDTKEPILAFRRENILCVFNLSNKPADSAIPDSELLGDISLGAKIISKQLELVGRGCAFLKLN